AGGAGGRAAPGGAGGGGSAPLPQGCARSAAVRPFRTPARSFRGSAPVPPTARVVTGRTAHRTGAWWARGARPPDPATGSAPVPYQRARSAAVRPFRNSAPVLPTARVVTGRTAHRTGASWTGARALPTARPAVRPFRSSA